MERRSFLKGASASTVLAATGLMTANANPILSSKEGQPYHFTKNLEQTRQIPGLVLNFIATGEHTNGTYSMLEGKIRKGAEPEMHQHENEDEAFYILEGEMIVTIGEKNYHVKPGDYVFLPRRIPHTQKLITETLHTLLFISPAGFEQYFWDLSAPATDFEIPPLSNEPPTEEQMKVMMEYNAKFGITYEK